METYNNVVHKRVDICVKSEWFDEHFKAYYPKEDMATLDYDCPEDLTGFSIWRHKTEPYDEQKIYFSRPYFSNKVHLYENPTEKMMEYLNDLQMFYPPDFQLDSSTDEEEEDDVPIVEDNVLIETLLKLLNEYDEVPLVVKPPRVFKRFPKKKLVIVDKK